MIPRGVLTGAFVLLTLALPLTAQVDASASIAGVWTVDDVPFGPWKLQLTPMGTRLTGTVSEAEYDPVTRETIDVRLLPIDSGSVIGTRVLIFLHVPPAASRQTIAFAGKWTDDSIVFTRTTHNLVNGPGAHGVFGASASERFITRRYRSVAPNPPTTIPPCATPGGFSGRWSAPHVTYAPWVLLACSDGHRVTGLIGQVGFDQTGDSMGALSSCPLLHGMVTGATVTFECVIAPPTGNRVVTFTGAMIGDSIVVVRAVRSLTGDGGSGTGIFGARGASTFTLYRTDSVPVAVSRGRVGGGGALALGTPSGRATYRGMTVDYSGVAPSARRDSVIDALHRQVDIVDDVTRRMSPAQGDFLRAVPLRVAEGPLDSTTNPGVYSATDKTVTLFAQMYAPDKPILLHELMHAYHDQRVTGGFANPEIQTLYRRAVASGRFPAGTYMLRNVQEYFAMMASVYLYGSAARDPLTRETIHRLQPDCYDWLVREFGPR